MTTTRDFSQVIRRRLANDQDLAEAVEREAFNANIAQQIFDARRKAGLTQKQLAERIGTKQSVIARLEDADYEGHSLSMLRRIGEALNCLVRVELYQRTRDATISDAADSVFHRETISWPQGQKEQDAITIEYSEVTS